MKVEDIVICVNRAKKKEKIIITNIHLNLPDNPQATHYPLEKDPRFFIINLPKTQRKYSE